MREFVLECGGGSMMNCSRLAAGYLPGSAEMAIIDRKIIGTEYPAAEVVVERGRLQFFAKAIGETRPIYIDPAAARAAGHPDLLAPPTFLYGLYFEAVDWVRSFADLGIDLGRVLHGEQLFTYHDDVHAGDTLRFHSQVTDVYAKKGGALEFLVRKICITRPDGKTVAELEETQVIRSPEAAK